MEDSQEGLTLCDLAQDGARVYDGSMTIPAVLCRLAPTSLPSQEHRGMVCPLPPGLLGQPKQLLRLRARGGHSHFLGTCYVSGIDLSESCLPAPPGAAAFCAWNPHFTLYV